MEAEITYKISKTDFDAAIEEHVSAVTDKLAFGRWQNHLVGVDTVAEIHSVNRDTVTRYANAGLIPFIRNGKLYKFRLAEVLKFDFNELRKRG